MAFTAIPGAFNAQPGNVEPGLIALALTAIVRWIGPFDPAEVMQGLSFATEHRNGTLTVSQTQLAALIAGDATWWSRAG